MDLRDIEAWGRELLEHEAAKRGIRNPEVYSRTDLVRLILKHDYGAPRNVKEAARLIGGIFGSARAVLKKRLNPLHGAGVRTYVGAAREDAARQTPQRAPSTWSADAKRMRDAEPARDAAKREPSAWRDHAERARDAEPARDVAKREPSAWGDHAERARDAEPARDAAKRDEETRSSGGSGSVRALHPATPDEAGAKERDALLGNELPRAGESEILERSYVGDRNLDVPSPAPSTAPTERDAETPHSYVGERNGTEGAGAAHASGALDIEHSYVGGRKLDVAQEEADALREAEQVRAEARDLRKESERVRSEVRAAGTPEADRSRPDAGWHRVRLGRDLPPTAAKPGQPQAETSRGAGPGADARESKPESSENVPERESARAASDTAAEAPVPHLRLVEPLSPSTGEAEAPALEPAAKPPSAPEPSEQLAYGPHPQDGLLLRWRVTSEAVERARQLLGAKGELAVRVVAVRVEPHAVVKTDVIDHGPIAEVGDWTAPLLPTEAKYVSAIGLRTANKFVSIVHAKS